MWIWDLASFRIKSTYITLLDPIRLTKTENRPQPKLIYLPDPQSTCVRIYSMPHLFLYVCDNVYLLTP